MAQEIEKKIDDAHQKIWKRINKSDEATRVDFSAMEKIGFFADGQLVSKGVKSTRIRLGLKDTLVFRVEMDKGAVIPAVVHNCKKRIFMQKGEIENLNTKYIIRSMVEDTIYPESKNTLKAHEKSVFYLRFYKPIK